MEFEKKNIIHEGIRMDKKDDCSKEALMMINKAIEFMETRQGQIGGIIISMAPSDISKDRSSIGALAGSMIKCGDMLLILFQELFERMPPEIIAHYINEFMDTIPDNKKSKALQISMGVKENEFFHDLEEIINKLEDDNNE